MQILQKKGNWTKIELDGKIGWVNFHKKKLNKKDIIQKIKEKYQVRCEREVVKGKKKLVDEYISIQDVVDLLFQFLRGNNL